jgi:hypothetical protein
MLRLIPNQFRVGELNAFLTDKPHLVGLSHSIFSRRVKLRPSNLTISVHSAVLLQAFKDDFGLMSLIISARFQGSLSSQSKLRMLAWIGTQTAARRPIGPLSLFRQSLRGLSFLYKRKNAL